MTTTTASLLLIAAYFVFLLISLKRRGKLINGPWLFLLRSFSLIGVFIMGREINLGCSGECKMLMAIGLCGTCLCHAHNFGG